MIYIDYEVIRDNDLIQEQFTTRSSTDVDVFDNVAFEVALLKYVNMADGIFKSLINRLNISDISNIPTYAEGMDQSCIDMLKAYVYCNYFGDKFTVANESDVMYVAHKNWCDIYEKKAKKITKEEILNGNEDASDDTPTFAGSVGRGGWD